MHQSNVDHVLIGSLKDLLLEQLEKQRSADYVAKWDDGRSARPNEGSDNKKGLELALPRLWKAANTPPPRGHRPSRIWGFGGGGEVATFRPLYWIFQSLKELPYCCVGFRDATATCRTRHGHSSALQAPPWKISEHQTAKSEPEISYTPQTPQKRTWAWNHQTLNLEHHTLNNGLQPPAFWDLPTPLNVVPFLSTLVSYYMILTNEPLNVAFRGYLSFFIAGS